MREVSRVELFEQVLCRGACLSYLIPGAAILSYYTTFLVRISTVPVLWSTLAVMSCLGLLIYTAVEVLVK